MTGKTIAGIVTGLIGGVVWQNGVKAAVFLALLYVDMRPAAAGSRAGDLGLGAGVAILAFYILRARRQRNALLAWGHNLIHIAYSLPFAGFAAAFVAFTLGSSEATRQQGLVVMAVCGGIGLVFFALGRALIKRSPPIALGDV